MSPLHAGVHEIRLPHHLRYQGLLSRLRLCQRWDQYHGARACPGVSGARHGATRAWRAICARRTPLDTPRVVGVVGVGVVGGPRVWYFGYPGKKCPDFPPETPPPGRARGHLGGGRTARARVQGVWRAPWGDARVEGHMRGPDTLGHATRGGRGGRGRGRRGGGRGYDLVARSILGYQW